LIQCLSAAAAAALSPTWQQLAPVGRLLVRQGLVHQATAAVLLLAQGLSAGWQHCFMELQGLWRLLLVVQWCLWAVQVQLAAAAAAAAAATGSPWQLKGLLGLSV
jgi:hypothetical protein